jgi:integrase
MTMNMHVYNPERVLTVAQAVHYWLEYRRNEVRTTTWRSYKQAASYIVGPLLVGTKTERCQFGRTGQRDPASQLLEMLGPTEIRGLTTAQIRAWHKTLSIQVGEHTANGAKKFLRAALCLVAEDFSLQVPTMPSRLGRGRTRPKKHILTPEQVGQLLEAAAQDVRGLYYAFPFLTGVRPSEQLALLWEDVDLEAKIIRIRRTQEPGGAITELTKTTASTREIPISPLLASMLVTWRAVCPKTSGYEYRVFPLLGRPGSLQAKKNGRPLRYTNFLYTYWRPALAALNLPIVTPHSARHAFISTLQASGIEIGLVAKLAGHSNATVTLGHYTQAVRGGEAAICALEHAWRKSNTPIVTAS